MMRRKMSNQKRQSRNLASYRNVLSIYSVLIVLVIGSLASGSEYDGLNNPSSIGSQSSAQYLSTSQRASSSGNYYSDPKSGQYQYYYPAESYAYGNGGNILSKQDFGDDDGGDGADGGGLVGLIGLIGLAGLIGLIPPLLPLIGPLLGLLFLLLLPILLPLIGPLLPILLLPLLILIAPLLLLFLPIPVITTPATFSGRNALPSTADGTLEMARAIYKAVSEGECIERYSCEVSHVARNFGFNINTDKIFGLVLGKKSASSTPKWMKSIARGMKSTESCQKYSCSGKLL